MRYGARVKREKQLTKKERKALKGPPAVVHQHEPAHIHCVACGRHLDEVEFTEKPARAVMLRCRHGSKFPSCTACRSESQRRLDTHDIMGRPVEQAAAWH